MVAKVAKKLQNLLLLAYKSDNERTFPYNQFLSATMRNGRKATLGNECHLRYKKKPERQLLPVSCLE